MSPALIPNTQDSAANHPLVSGNHNQQQQHQGNQNQGYGGQQQQQSYGQNESYGGQQSNNIPGGYGGQQQQSFQGQGQGGDFSVTGGPQYNAPHGSGGAGSAAGGGIGSLLGMMNRMSSLSLPSQMKLIILTGSRPRTSYQRRQRP